MAPTEMTAGLKRSHDANTALAARIAAYWAKRGHTITTEVVPIKAFVDDRDVTLFTLKSDMVNGLPRSKAEAGGKNIPTRPTIRRISADQAGGLFHY